MIRLSDHFDVKRLIRFTLPSIVMMIFTSIYGVVDGYFVSNFAGKTPFAAVNLIMPLLMILGCVGFMFGTGGGALIAETISGEGNDRRANEIFSMVIYVSVALGALLGIVGLVFLRPIAKKMGADGELSGKLRALCADYSDCAAVLCAAIRISVPVCDGGKAAAWAMCYGCGGLRKYGAGRAARRRVPAGALPARRSQRRSVRRSAACSRWFISQRRIRAACASCAQSSISTRSGKVCANGSSEFMSNISMSLVGMLYNIQLIKYAGQDGIAAYGVLMYVSMIFQAIFIGYAVGVAPVVGYHYGAQNTGELSGLLKRSFAMLAVCAAAMFAMGQCLAVPLSKMFVGYDQGLFEITKHAFAIFSFSFLFRDLRSSVLRFLLR